VVGSSDPIISWVNHWGEPLGRIIGPTAELTHRANPCGYGTIAPSSEFGWCSSVTHLEFCLLELFTSTLRRRQLTTPLLLLLASHRPLTFLSGQLLYALAPLCLLLGWEGANKWAAFLSETDADQRLLALLANSANDLPVSHGQIS
jgi:hypothetical protein